MLIKVFNFVLAIFKVQPKYNIFLNFLSDVRD